MINTHNKDERQIVFKAYKEIPPPSQILVSVFITFNPLPGTP